MKFNVKYLIFILALMLLVSAGIWWGGDFGGQFKADLSFEENDVCQFTSEYIQDGTWQDYLGGLPNTNGPEDKIDILGLEYTCESNGCTKKSQCADTVCSDGFSEELSTVQELARLPYSLSEIEILSIKSSSNAEALVTALGDVTNVGSKYYAKITNKRVTGEKLEIGSVLPEPDEKLDRSKLNLGLYLKHISDLKQNEKACAMVIYKVKTDFNGSVKGKITGDATDEEESGISNAKVTLSPCPEDDREIRTIPEGASCEVETDASGNYVFPKVLPRKDGYKVSAQRY